MRLNSLCLSSLLAANALASSFAHTPSKPKHRSALTSPERRSTLAKRDVSLLCSTAAPIKPKIVIISMQGQDSTLIPHWFSSEAEIWYEDTSLNLYANNVTVPGFSSLFPDAHCTASGEVCQMTTGEGEINAAASILALWLSKCFDLTSTYFMIAGISGGNPHHVTTGSVTFAKYAVQVGLQEEFDHSQTPDNATSGYYPQNADYPDEASSEDYPGSLYGTEVYEVNENLRDRAYYLASLAKLNDTDAAAKYRANYQFAPANQPPRVVKCDSATSDQYWSGSVLGDAFGNYTELLTNGSGIYCGTQQEDNATLESLLRGAVLGMLDYSRVIIMRTISDFDRAPPGETEVYHLLYAAQEGFTPSIHNIYVAGIEIVKDVMKYWNGTYDRGLTPGNYIGDVFNSLPGPFSPDIGTAASYIN
ncbi:purine nucleoside permease [Aureobasidium subglaciale]|nr:purine nucleoside permease [Aureobasidium subglaciale]